MKNKDKIILYLDGQMNEKDRSMFEKDLASDSQLKSEMEEYKQFMDGISSLKNIKTEPDYFINIVPEFRKNLNTKAKSRLIPKFAFVLSAITAVVLLLLFTLNRSDNIAPNYSSTNIDSVIDNYTFNYSPLHDQFDINSLNNNDYSNLDSVVSVMLSNELNLSSQSLSDLTTTNVTTDLQSMLQGINNREADQIYNELLHKRIY